MNQDSKSTYIQCEYFDPCIDKIVNSRMKIKILKLLNQSYIYMKLDPICKSDELEKQKILFKKNDQTIQSVLSEIQSQNKELIYKIDIVQSLITYDDQKEMAIINIKNLQSNLEILHFKLKDLQTYMDIIENKMEADIRIFNLNLMIKQILNIIQIQAWSKLIQIESIQQLQDHECNNDYSKIYQILLNILQNSVKFSNQGKINLKVIDFPEKNLIMFECIDNGIGIEQHIIDLIQNKNYQSAINRDQYGIGMGFFLIKNILKSVGPFDNVKINSSKNETSVQFYVFKDMNKVDINYQNKSFFTQFDEQQVLKTMKSSSIIIQNNSTEQFTVKDEDHKEIQTQSLNLFGPTNLKEQPIILENKYKNRVKNNVLVVVRDLKKLLRYQYDLLNQKEFNLNIICAINGQMALNNFMLLNQRHSHVKLELIILTCEISPIERHLLAESINEKISNDQYLGVQIRICKCQQIYSQENNADQECLLLKTQSNLVSYINEQLK